MAVDARHEPDRDPLGWLVEESHTVPPADLPVVVGEAMRRLGARSSAMFVVDHDQMSLHPLRGGTADAPDGDDDADATDDAGAGTFAVDGTVGGRAFCHETTVSVPAGGGTRLWVPLLDGTARLGVMSVDVDADPVDPDVVTSIERCASLAAELLVCKGHYTDVVELARRRTAMTLEAELQRCTLPPVALVTPWVAVAGMLLPAYEVAGDSFDYALNRDVLEVAVIDSVGHELESSMLSHLVYGSLRNSRRNDQDLPQAYALADAAVARVFPDVRFATAAFGSLDLRSGRFRWISAGHPPPLVVRGGKAVGEAPTTPVVPIGLGGRHPPVNEVVLDPGDQLFLYTDGVTEGGVPGGARFGLDRLADLLGRSLLAGLPPSETVRRLARAVLTHSEHRLRDDTTMVLVDYRAAPGQPSRTTSAGSLSSRSPS